MSTSTDRPTAFASQHEVPEPVSVVLNRLLDHMKPKARQAARASLEAYVARLETWEGCRLPENVSFLRHWQGSKREQALASAAHRQERAEQAAAIRALIGRAF